MEEESYRQSRLCRLLGNPVAFAVVKLLGENKELNPSAIARAVGRSVPRVSNVLGALRLVDVVRYDSDGKRNYYRLKHPREIRQVLAALSRVVEASSKVPPATASHCNHFHVFGIPKRWKFASNADTLCGFSEVTKFQQAYRRTAPKALNLVTVRPEADQPKAETGADQI